MVDTASELYIICIKGDFLLKMDETHFCLCSGIYACFR